MLRVVCLIVLSVNEYKVISVLALQSRISFTWNERTCVNLYSKSMCKLHNSDMILVTNPCFFYSPGNDSDILLEKEQPRSFTMSAICVHKRQRKTTTITQYPTLSIIHWVLDSLTGVWCLFQHHWIFRSGQLLFEEVVGGENYDLRLKNW